MSDVKKCDKCKTLDDCSDYEQIVIHCGRYGFERKWISSFDLCPKCYLNFLEYLDTIKKVNTGEEK